MTYKDGKWIPDPHPQAKPPQKKKRNVSEAMKAASRDNGLMSTGPRPENRARSAMNATTHAMTRQITDAIGEARSDVTPAGSKRNAYAARSTRLQFAALRMLFTLQRERRNFGEGDLSEPDPPASNGEEPQTEPTTVLDALLQGDDGGCGKSNEKRTRRVASR